MLRLLLLLLILQLRFLWYLWHMARVLASCCHARRGHHESEDVMVSLFLIVCASKNSNSLPLTNHHRHCFGGAMESTLLAY